MEISWYILFATISPIFELILNVSLWNSQFHLEASVEFLLSENGVAANVNVPVL